MYASCHVAWAHAQVRDHARLLTHADILFFFNPFELHWSRTEHAQLLLWLTRITRHGQYILSCPSLVDIYARADVDVDVDAWVELVTFKEDAYLWHVK